MLRAIWLTTQNEARLLVKDPIVLFMLLFAPVVIITVAGYSLGSLYGGSANSFRLPVVDLDHGKVAQGIIEALRREHAVALEVLDDPDEARRLVSRRDRTPIAMLIPGGTSASLAAGGQPRLILFVDPVRRVEVNALELRVADVCRAVTEHARLRAQEQLDREVSNFKETVRRISKQAEQADQRVQSQLERDRRELEASIRAQTNAAIRETATESQETIQQRQQKLWEQMQEQLLERQTALSMLESYLGQLHSAERAFDQWFAKLKEAAGTHAREIPEPPQFPSPPPQAELSLLAMPITLPSLDQTPPVLKLPQAISLKAPPLPAIALGNLSDELSGLESLSIGTLPGGLGFTEHTTLENEPVVVSAFDQYVPGFGVTFLLIGMMLGIALTLFDERDWGTLKRLQVGGAPLTGLLLGKLFARFIVGIAQMVLLFAVGWALFGISLGRNPLALIIPTVGISFAAAALALVVASVATAHDSVMSLGVTISMAMAAIGGCWWPLDFEPGWMRELARWLPTTWTMQAFNDLTIRNQPPSAALLPLAATIGIGVIFIVAGLLRFLSLDD
ncbi:MAG: ABC transporter permease [Deltaproteobacteria bacterium]|nr:ABC transporter permease [Deltaproteobacteria bacterium]